MGSIFSHSGIPAAMGAIGNSAAPAGDDAQGVLYGVSLGPGEPELITLKALRILERSEVICCPGTPDRMGGIGSLALDILRALGLPESRFRVMAVPMFRNPEIAGEKYPEHFSAIAGACREGKTVAVASVGDAGFFSTFTPFMQMAAREGIMCRVVAGVPAFLAAGAAACIPLALHDDRVTVVAMAAGTEELERAVQAGGTVVVMKLSTIRKELVPWLERSGQPFLYAEKVGMPGEFITSDIRQLRRRSIPYFSLLICSRHCPQPAQNIEHKEA